MPDTGYKRDSKMDINQLRKYTNWIGKSPVQIRNAVIAAGGWAKVFAMNVAVGSNQIGFPELKTTSTFPEWASRVRNYFNVTPITLELLSPVQGNRRTRQIKNRRGINIWIPTEFFANAFALNGKVYADEHGRPWFEMDKIGSVYHYPGKVNARKKVGAALAKSNMMPVFKLISPDDTGGSLELCVYNLKNASTIGKVGEEVQVSPILVKDEIYRGSYNYAETVVRGLTEHEYRDVMPHKEDKGFYLNPEIYSYISNRRFPVNDNNGKPIILPKI
jgi:hypothetical protein